MTVFTFSLPEFSSGLFHAYVRAVFPSTDSLWNHRERQASHQGGEGLWFFERPSGFPQLAVYNSTLLRPSALAVKHIGDMVSQYRTVSRKAGRCPALFPSLILSGFLLP